MRAVLVMIGAIAATVMASVLSDSTGCDDCKAVVAAVKKAVDSNISADVLQAVAEEVCLAGHGGFGYSCTGDWACHDLCRGITELFVPVVLRVGTNLTLDPPRDCAALGFCNASSVQGAVQGSAGELSVMATPPKPAQPAAAAPVPVVEDTLRVLHITDLHWDPNYTVGARTDCGEPDCCRGVQGLAPAGNATLACGYWGDHAGDTPTSVVDTMLAYAASLKPDFVLLTGDYPPHMVWNVTAEAVLNVTRAFSAKVKAALGDVPVFGSAGNHEGAPINQFRLELDGEGARRLFRPVAEQWQGYGWLGAEAAEQLARGGYYTTLVPGVSTAAGRRLRLAVMHPGYHMHSNMNTLLDDSINVANESSWLQATLADAEAAGDIVWLLTHHPLNDGGYNSTYMNDFLAPLLARYRSTVRHVFSGHTHKAMVQLLWSNATGGAGAEPAIVTYVGAAPTPYGGVNPTFRTYDVSTSSLEVQDYTDYTLDLRAQGVLHQLTEVPRPQWRASYSAREAYGMSSLSPAAWRDMAERMRSDDALFRRWETFYHTNNTQIASFDAAERLERVCDVIGGTKLLNKLCHDGKFNASA